MKTHDTLQRIIDAADDQLPIDDMEHVLHVVATQLANALATLERQTTPIAKTVAHEINTELDDLTVSIGEGDE